MIGDSSNDAQAARAAGCQVLLVTYGYNHGLPVRTVDADAFTDSLQSLTARPKKSPSRHCCPPPQAWPGCLKSPSTPAGLAQGRLVFCLDWDRANVPQRPWARPLHAAPCL